MKHYVIPNFTRIVTGGKSQAVEYLLEHGKDAGVIMTKEDPHPVILILVMRDIVTHVSNNNNMYPEATLYQ
jgi:hypothetical protein